MNKIKIAGLLLAWPFLCLFLYVIPINGRFLEIGNDFLHLYYVFKPYLLDHLIHGRIPLWSPSEAAGFVFHANPFAAVYYPLNIPLAVFYKLFGGYSVLDHQRFAVFGLSLYGLGLYSWLRSLNIPLRPALFSALIMGVSFKLTELLRFPNAIHAAAWMPWTLFSVTQILKSSASLKKMWAYGSLLLFSCVSLLTAGYPYFIYYFAFLLVPYLVVCIVPKLRRNLLKIGEINWLKVCGVFAAAGVATLSLVGPYLKQISQLMRQTTDRNLADFDFSTQHVFNWTDSLGSLVFPPAAQIEGWYYFGALPLALIVVFLFYKRRPLLIVFWIAVISYITYGKFSYLFSLLWGYLPYFSHLRVWGRMNIILVPLFAWLLALSYEWLEKNFSSHLRVPFAAVFSGIILIQIVLFVFGVEDSYWAQYYATHLSLPKNFKLIFIFATLAACLYMTFQLNKAKAPLLFVGLLIFSLPDVLGAGIWTWCKKFRPADKRETLNIAAANEKSFRSLRYDINTTISLDNFYFVGVVDNWHFERYAAFRKKYSREEKEMRELLGIETGQKLFISSQSSYPSIREFLDDADKIKASLGLVRYSGDELLLSVRLPRDGYLSFIDNWEKNWSATVDGQVVPIEMLFGTFKTVPVPQGDHRVQFKYHAG